MALQIARRRFTVDEYYRLADDGILDEDDRVELIDGEIVEMSPIGPSHSGCETRVNRHLGQRLGDTALVSVQNPVRLDQYNEPQPDVVLLCPRGDYYFSHIPRPADVLLLVEIADSSLAYDRRVKLPLYARFGIPEVWLVDLNRSVIRVHRDPGSPGYRTARTVRRGERLAPLAFPECELAVADILGDAEGAS